MVSVRLANQRDLFAQTSPGGARRPSSVAFQRFMLKRHGLRPLVFDGALLVEHSLGQPSSARQVVRIWETANSLVLQIEVSSPRDDDEEATSSSYVSVCSDADDVRAAMETFDPTGALSGQMTALLSAPQQMAEGQLEAYSQALAAMENQHKALVGAFDT